MCFTFLGCSVVRHGFTIGYSASLKLGSKVIVWCLVDSVDHIFVFTPLMVVVPLERVRRLV
jgi:hypothetical protein